MEKHWGLSDMPVAYLSTRSKPSPAAKCGVGGHRMIRKDTTGCMRYADHGHDHLGNDRGG